MKLFGKQNLFKNEKFNLLILTVAALLITLPILIYGIPDGYDLPHHLQCTQTYIDSIRNGDFYPSWSADRNFGYGGLELRMYPPISHYLLALLKLLTGNWQLAVWASYVFWCFIGCLGIYFWAKEFVNPANALFAALLFAVIPYRINEIYQTFLYAEFAGGSILPFCFAFLTRILKSGDEKNGLSSYFSRDALGLAVALAALILTHLPLTLIGIISLGVYFLSQTKWNFSAFLSNAAKVSIAGFLGLAASSFFWLKVVQERFMMAKTLNNEEIDVHYTYNYLLTPLQNYSEESFRVSYTAALYDLVLLTTLLVVIPMAIIGLLKNRSLEKQLWRSLWIVFAFSIFISTVLSKPLWDTLPLLFEVQFPWRWLNIVSIFAPILAAGGFSFCLEWYKNEKSRVYFVSIFGAILICLSLSISWAISTSKVVSPEKSEIQTAKMINDGGFKFWWTIWAKEDLKKAPAEKVLAQNRQTEIIEWKDTNREIVIDAGQSTQARIAVFYHPNWQAFVNNNLVEIHPDSSGAITFTVPPEKSNVTLKFSETKAILIARKISWAALTVLIILFFVSFKKNKIEG